MVAVDFSKPSRKAFDAAVGMAKDLDATLVLVHAVEPVPRGGKRDPIGQAKAEVDAAEWEELCSTWAQSARKSVDVETVAKEGKPADVVLAVVTERKAGMVVVGSHGRTGVKRAVLGSVAEAIVRASKVPVVVVPS